MESEYSKPYIAHRAELRAQGIARCSVLLMAENKRESYTSFLLGDEESVGEFMKSSAAKNALAGFFEMEETASGWVARCPNCAVRYAVTVKRNVVPDDYVRLLLNHAKEERGRFESAGNIQSGLASAKSE
jgi:hypothetical protein